MSRIASVSASSSIGFGQRAFATAKKIGLWAAGLTLLAMGVVLVAEAPWVVGILALVGIGFTCYSELRERLGAKSKSAQSTEEMHDSPLAHW